MEEIEKLTELKIAYPYLDSLNYNQQIAASIFEGNTLVVGGPGTGKTHTLAYRCLHLINQGVDPSQIYLITFTRKAAKSLRQRIESLIPGTNIGYIGTFHALATKIIAEDNHLFSWRLIDYADDYALVDLTCESGPIGTSKLLNIFNYYANTQKEMEDVLIDLELEQYLDYSEKIAQAYNHYFDAKVRNKYLSYDDLLLAIVRNSKLTAKLNIKHLMVDEFQDITRLQLEFIRVINPQNIMVMGDDFQNIYRFRGTDNQLLLNFDQYFSKPKLVELTISYRCNNQITKCLNKIVLQTQFGHSKVMIADPQTNDGEFKIYGGLEDSTQLIIGHIQSNKLTHGIIYRRNKMRSLMEQELILRNIPYQIYGGINLLERVHIKTLISIISLINNPSDYLSHIQVLKLSKIEEKQAIEDISYFNFREKSDLPTAELVTYQFKTVEQILDIAIDYYFKQVPYDLKNQDINDDFMIIRKLANGYANILEFINAFTLDAKVDFSTTGDNQPRVILTNIHASKGLEFDCVHFLYGFNKFKEMSLSQMEEEARIFYVGLSRAKQYLYIYDNISPPRSLNDMINDFIDSPKRENYKLTYDDPRISDVNKITIHLDQDDIEYTIEENHRFDLKSLLNFFRK